MWPFPPRAWSATLLLGPQLFFLNLDLHIYFGPCRWNPKDFLVKLTKSCAPHRSPRALAGHGALILKFIFTRWLPASFGGRRAGAFLG